MSKGRFTALNKKKVIKLLEEFGYKTTSQSSDGSYTLIRTPDGDSTGYWLFSDRIEHRGEHPNGVSTCSYFNYSDCYALVEENSISIIVKNIKHNGVFIIFFNYTPQPTQEKEQ